MASDAAILAGLRAALYFDWPEVAYAMTYRIRCKRRQRNEKLVRRNRVLRWLKSSASVKYPTVLACGWEVLDVYDEADVTMPIEKGPDGPVIKCGNWMRH